MGKSKYADLWLYREEFWGSEGNKLHKQDCEVTGRAKMHIPKAQTRIYVTLDHTTTNFGRWTLKSHPLHC